MGKKGKIFLTVLLFLLPIVFLLSVAFAVPVYGDTYYAALKIQYDRLTSVNERKVVLVGGSNVAFGTDSELFEFLYGAPLVGVGLYGVFGTKLMMELSKANLRQGDTVVLCPELSADSYSTNQNFTALWKASEKSSLFLRADFDDYDRVVGSLLPFALEKREYLLSGEKPVSEGIYAYSSVNEYGEIKKGLRKGNIMRAGYIGEEILSSPQDIGDGFIDCVNDYVRYCNNRGVTVYFSFSPVNEKALKKQGIEEETLYALYDYLRENLDCQIISDPNGYVFKAGYFYDTNYHLNDAGAILRTVQLVRDLKAENLDSSALGVELPACPPLLSDLPEIDDTLSYTDASLFTYEEEDGLLVIVGVKEEAKGLESVVLPVEYEGKRIYNVAGGAFVGSQWKRVDVPVGISELSGGAFRGCSALKEIRLYETSGKNINVYDSTFDGVSADCRILLMRADKNSFLNGDGMYMWQRVSLPIEEAKNDE